jgi:hypothetical protein
MAAQPTLIYHITHVDNLPAILAAGGLRCCGELHRLGITYQNIAYATLQDRRAGTVVPCGPGGNLHEYVPFYFAPRSPMLYTINQGNVPGYTQGQRPVLHLVSTAQAVYSANRPAVFTDGHAIMALSEFFTDLADLDRIDWDLMDAVYWADTLDDNDRKRRRQAEFPVHQQVPWELITEIGVLDRPLRAQVEQLLAAASHRPPVTIRRKWYYGVRVRP